MKLALIGHGGIAPEWTRNDGAPEREKVPGPVRIADGRPDPGRRPSASDQ